MYSSPRSRNAVNRRMNGHAHDDRSPRNNYNDEVLDDRSRMDMDPRGVESSSTWMPEALKEIIVLVKKKNLESTLRVFIVTNKELGVHNHGACCARYCSFAK